MTDDINLFHVEHLTADEVLHCIREELGHLDEITERATQELQKVASVGKLNNDDYQRLLQHYEVSRTVHNQSLELITLLNYIEAKDEEKGIKEASA